MGTVLQNIDEYCCKCNIPKQFRDGQLDLSAARRVCARCRIAKGGIYKFDIAYSLYDKVNKVVPPPGKGETYFKRYGAAVRNLLEQGFSTRQIADTLGISPTSVTKIRKKLGS